jgi:glycosyltransferase involved in cell wall biosynthesis
MDYGGAGAYSLDFHRLMMSNGFDSYLIVKDKRTEADNVFSYPDGKLHQTVSKIRRRIAKFRITDETFEHDYHFYNRYERIPIVSAKRILNLLPAKPDLIFFHWVTDYINALTMKELYRLSGARMYWLMIDNAPLTGGCHYPWECEGYQKTCSDCPAINDPGHKQLSRLNLEYKIRHLPPELSLITFSASDDNRARKSALFKNRDIVKMIGFVDEEKFAPADKAQQKENWGIDKTRKVIFFGVTNLNDKRKGYSYLVKAVNALDYDNVVLLVAGKKFGHDFNVEVKHVGYLLEPELIKAYQAADLFVCPSIEDSGPMMINQSIMCGTPVVAFETGVALDLVITGKTGYRARLKDSGDLAFGINTILSLDDQAYKRMSMNCRELGVKCCRPNMKADRLLQFMQRNSINNG